MKVERIKEKLQKELRKRIDKELEKFEMEEKEHDRAKLKKMDLDSISNQIKAKLTESLR